MKEFTADYRLIDGEVYIKLTDMARLFRELSEDAWNPEPFKLQAELFEATAYRVLTKSKEQNDF